MDARPEDAVFAQHVLEKRYATEAQVQECLKLLERLRGEMELDESLGNVMLKKGYLSQAQLRALEQALDPTRVADRKNAIPGYRLLERIGVGAMGAVYKAHHLKLDIPVAIKVLRTALSASQTQIERLKREAQLVARLTHPNIVVSRDVGEADGIHYLAMEYVDGSTVRELMRGKTLPEKQALQIAREVARALEHAHERGIIHRDVKPGNIMVTRDGHVKLADFGLARGKTPSDLTLEHASIGTPQYVAPEQMRRAGDATSRSDLFSLGATLYHLVTGQPPFDGENLGEIVQNVLACRFQPPETVRRDLSVDTLYVIHKLMRADPRERYASAADLIADLDRIDRGERVAPSSFRGDQQAYLRRKRARAVGIVVGVAVAVAAFGFVAAHYIRKSREERARVEECRGLDATGAVELTRATTVGRLRDVARGMRASFEAPHACRTDELAALRQRLDRVEADVARVDEADAALRAADERDARFRDLYAGVEKQRGAVHFPVAREHVEQVARDILVRSRAEAKRRHTEVYYEPYGHMREAREALAALARDLRDRFATTDLVEETARDSAAYGRLVDAWKSVHDEWEAPYEEARRAHRYAEAWARYESFREGCKRALDAVRDTGLSEPLLRFFEVADDAQALSEEERRYFRDRVVADAERALQAGDPAEAERIADEFRRVAKVTRREADDLLERIRGRANVELAAQRKALALLEERIREGLRRRDYDRLAQQIEQLEATRTDWLPEVRAELETWKARAAQLARVRKRFDEKGGAAEAWAAPDNTAQLEELLEFSDGRMSGPKLRGHFLWAESYRARDPRAAAELLRRALLDLDGFPWADELRVRRQGILDGLPKREEEAKQLLKQLEEAEARKDYGTAIIKCRLLLDDGRDGLLYTDTVSAKGPDQETANADQLRAKLAELVRRAGASVWREQAGLPNDKDHFNVDPESDRWAVTFDFRPWWPDEGKEQPGVDREQWLAERGKEYWHERFRKWGIDETRWPHELERARHQLLRFSKELVPAPGGGAVLAQDYAAWWLPGDGKPRSFELEHPFLVDKPWSVEMVVRWEDPPGVEGAPGYFALAAGNVQAGVVCTPDAKIPSGGRGALLFEADDMVPDDLEKRFEPFRNGSKRPKPKGPGAVRGLGVDLRAGADYRIRLSRDGDGVVRFALGPAQGKMRDIVWGTFRNLDRLLAAGRTPVFRFVSLTTCRVLRVEMRGQKR